MGLAAQRINVEHRQLNDEQNGTSVKYMSDILNEALFNMKFSFQIGNICPHLL